MTSAFGRASGKKLSRSHAEPAAEALRGKRVHVDSAVVRAVASQAALDGALDAVGATAEPARETADAFFLVPSVTQPGKRVLLNAGWSGGRHRVVVAELDHWRGPARELSPGFGNAPRSVVQ